LKSLFKIIPELGKVRISLPVALSALTGYIMFTGEYNLQGWFLALGVFFMSCSSGALNHWQESDTDAKMPRTKNRPIPSGKISRNGAFLVALGFAIVGSLILILTNPKIALILSWVTLFFYNLVYTPLKKVTDWLGWCRWKYNFGSNFNCGFVLFYRANPAFLVVAAYVWRSVQTGRVAKFKPDF
jgi:protoheme IX farnesyltransferase